MGIEQEIQFPDMESCLEVRASVLEQVEDAQALCIPAGAEDLSMKRMDRFFNKFMEMIERLEISYKDWLFNLSNLKSLDLSNYSARMVGDLGRIIFILTDRD